MYKTVTADSQTFYYLDYGGPEKDTLLFLHGYADSAMMFAKLARSLSHKHRVICLDFPMIHEPDKVQSLQSLASYVKKFADTLGLKNFTLVGFSLGGSVAIELVYQNGTDVKGLYLLNSVPRLLPTTPWRLFYGMLKPLLTTKWGCRFYSQLNTNRFLRIIFHSPPVKEIILTRMRESPISIFGTVFNILDADLTDRFISIAVPKTVVLFKDDTVVPWKRYRAYLEKLEINLIVFDKGWHAARDEYWDSIRSLWLDSRVDEKFIVEKLEL